VKEAEFIKKDKTQVIFRERNFKECNVLIQTKTGKNGQPCAETTAKKGEEKRYKKKEGKELMETESKSLLHTYIHTNTHAQPLTHYDIRNAI
jgi:hypothetical protein